MTVDEKKVEELAETLKAAGLSANIEEAKVRAREILSAPDRREQKLKEQAEQQQDNDELDQTKSVQELMDEDAEHVYNNQKQDEGAKEDPVEETCEDTAKEAADPEDEAPEKKDFLDETEGP